ncbi:hypothetical protein MLD38_023046 [Melastoma candidum]|uniref:Uncharacterized protein n=1 Tax=Melastoma candidum TaxID=119954 RepID=A0ACB9QLF6_9MYRT|nr:hypothetical protein MLD38_023046 [Melastoma candidum]
MAAMPPIPSVAEAQSPTPISPLVVLIAVNATPPRSTPSVPTPFASIPLSELSPPPLTPPPPPPPSPPPPLPVPLPSSPPPWTTPPRTPASPPPPPPPTSFVSPNPVLVPAPPAFLTPWAPSASSSQPLPSASKPPSPRSSTPNTRPHKTPASPSNSASPANDVPWGLSSNLSLTIGITAVSVALVMLIIFGLILCICTLKKKNKQSTGANYSNGHPPLPLAHHAQAGSIGHLSYYGSSKHPSNRVQASLRRVPPGADPVPVAMDSPGMPGGQPMGPWAPIPPLVPTDKANTSRSSSFKNGSGSFKNGSCSFRNRSGSFRNVAFINHSSFSYEELAAATGGFGRATVLGHGGFGYVHKGVLSDGMEVAVKCLKMGARQGDREFQAEVEIISRVHHRHLVSLVGYCIEGSQRILVYEFIPNKTLDYHLHGRGRPCLDWSLRLRIALGAARGLAYLHEDCHPRIIHRDIKATNILLDMNFEAKVADFGLAKHNTDDHTHVSTRVMGTFGYLAPEYVSSGKLTEKSDVYSFGVMLLELITGRRPFDSANKSMEDGLVDWARPEIMKSMEEGGNFSRIADPRLEGNYTLHEMARMVACAGACIRHSAKLRPKMSQVVRALEQDSGMEDLNEWRKLTDPSRRSSNSLNDYDTLSSDSMRKTPSRTALNGSGSDDRTTTDDNNFDPSSPSGEDGRLRGKDAA